MKMKLVLSMFILLALPLFASASPHNTGTNISSNGTIFMITADGQRRPYTSAGAFLSYGFNSWATVIQANTDDLALPIGSFIPPRDGKIVCSNNGGDKGTCYLITDGKKAAFTSAAVFTGLGFNFSNSLSGDVSFLTSSPNISSSSQAHSAGTLVNKNGTIYLVGDNGLIGVPDMSTLNSWGYSTSDVVTANLTDSSNSQSGVMAIHTPAALSPLENSSLSFGTTNPNPTQAPASTAIPAPTADSTVVAPISTGFSASPATITNGNSTTLYFHLYNNPTSIYITPNIGTILPGQTSLTISPATTTLYTLTASNSAGSITEQALVNVYLSGSSCDSNGNVWNNNNCVAPSSISSPTPTTSSNSIQQEAARITTAINSELSSLNSQLTVINNTSLGFTLGNLNLTFKDVPNIQQGTYLYPVWQTTIDNLTTKYNAIGATIKQLNTISFEVQDYSTTGVLPPASDRAYLLSLGINW